MALVTSDILLLTQAGIKTEFAGAYLQSMENADWQSVATEIPTTLPIQNYGWLGRGAVMKEYKDEPEEQSANEKTYQIADKIYKANFAIQRKAIEDDQYGQIMLRAREQAQEPVRFQNELLFGLLPSGFSTVCYDGQFFFNASHVDGTTAAQSNLLSAANLSDTNLETAHTMLTSFLDDKGKPFHARPDTLVVGPLLERRAWNLMGQPTVVTPVGSGTAGSGATASTPFANFFQGRYKVVVNPYIQNYNWFLMDCSREVKPLVLQSREDVPITLETDMDMPDAKIREKYQIVVRGRFAAAYGLWQLAVGASGTA